MGLLSVQGIGLEPFFAVSDPVGSGVRLHPVASRHEVGDNRLTHQGRQRLTIRLVPRTGDNHAHNSVVAVGRNWACIQPRQRINRPLERIGQRHVEHVVRHLAGGIAASSGVIPHPDLEIAQALLGGSSERVGSQATVDILLAIERAVVLEDEDSKFGGRQRRLLQKHIDRRCAWLARSDLRSADRVAALTRSGREIRATRTRRAIQLNVKLPLLATDRHCAATAVSEGVPGIPGQNRNVVALGWVKVDLRRVQRRLLRCGGPANAIAKVANRRVVISCVGVDNTLPRFASNRAPAAHTTRRNHWHVAGVEICP